MEIRQCKRCSKIFQYSGNPICQSCVKEMDQIFIAVRDFLYANPGADMEKICEETGAESQDIRRWLSEGRLLLSSNSVPMLQCEKCGAPIRTGRLCNECTDVMRSQFKGVADSMRPAPEPFKSEKQQGRMHVDVRKK